MYIKVVNTAPHPLPEYQTQGAAGLDLYAFLKTKILLKPLERRLISTGLFIEIPQGYEVQIRPRSGLALKKGLTVLNSPGTIDADYRGELKVLLINLSDRNQCIENGDRIAQMVLASCEKIEWKKVDKLSDTERGAGGYGSTGN